MRRFALLVLTLFTITGCGGGLKEFPTEKVTGKVLCDGQPVPNVRVYFAPVGGAKKVEAGKPGLGNAKADGTFTVSTYGKEDGAVVGKHNVMVSTPHPEDFPDFSCGCETDGNKTVGEVEVAKGASNDFEIVLPPKVAKNKPSIRKKDLDDIKASKEG